jgi:hypothetical protein
MQGVEHLVRSDSRRESRHPWPPDHEGGSVGSPSSGLRPPGPRRGASQPARARSGPMGPRHRPHVPPHRHAKRASTHRDISAHDSSPLGVAPGLAALPGGIPEIEQPMVRTARSPMPAQPRQSSRHQESSHSLKGAWCGSAPIHFLEPPESQGVEISAPQDRDIQAKGDLRLAGESQATLRLHNQRFAWDTRVRRDRRRWRGPWELAGRTREQFAEWSGQCLERPSEGRSDRRTAGRCK